MILDHTPSPLDYGLYGLLAVVMIRELFSLIRFAFTLRKNSGNAGNPHMTASELRGYLKDMSTKLDQAVSGIKILLDRRGDG